MTDVGSTTHRIAVHEDTCVGYMHPQFSYLYSVLEAFNKCVLNQINAALPPMGLTLNRILLEQGLQSVCFLSSLPNLI